MKRGRAGRKSNYSPNRPHLKRHSRSRGMGARAVLLAVLAAGVVIYGVAELRPGRGHEEAGDRISLAGSGSGPESKPGDVPGEPGKEAVSAPVLEQKGPAARKIQVVDVEDFVDLDIPVGWQEHPEAAETRTDLEKAVAGIAGKWDRQPVDSQMEAFDSTTGNFQYSKAVDGRVLDQKQLVESLTQAIKMEHPQVKAAFLTIAPKRTQAQAKEQYEVIGTFSTTTTSDKNRNQNIRLAAQSIDGLVLKPGEEFSFNDTTGNRTSDKGYQPAGAYKNGVLIEEPGGGVCQVSTTLYHAIMNSGLKTTERNAHSIAPSYIDKGQDAMVSFDGYAGPDLKFVNSASTTVGLRASFKDKRLKLSIVGLPLMDDGTTVSLRSEKIRDLDPPEPIYEENPQLAYGEEKVMEHAKPGSVWKTYKQIIKDGKVLEETALNTSTYKAKPARIQRNSAARPEESGGQDAQAEDNGGTSPEEPGAGGQSPQPVDAGAKTGQEADGQTSGAQDTQNDNQLNIPSGPTDGGPDRDQAPTSGGPNRDQAPTSGGPNRDQAPAPSPSIPELTAPGQILSQ